MILLDLATERELEIFMPPTAPRLGSRWPPFLLLLLTSIGIPGGVLAVFREDIPRHPWLTLGLFLTWEVLVFLVGVVADVWSKLRSKWVDWLADWLERRVISLFSGFRHRYLKWIRYQHRDFDVKGLSTQGTYNLELEHVFVDLTIDPRPPHESSPDPLRLPNSKGRRQIWDYLEKGKGHFALLGAPGSGKTTLLKKVALQVVGKRHPRMRQSIPILLFLREHGESIQSNLTYSLIDAVTSALDLKRGPLAPVGWFQRRLATGRCLVLFDGLDEVADVEMRGKVATWVECQMNAYPENRFLLTSRPYGYRATPVTGVTVLEVQPFNREQVQRFVHNWYLANEIRAFGKLDPGVDMKAREGAEDLLRRLGKSQTLIELSVNPLLLTMIATVHRFRSSLPGRRVELYAEICEVFLGKRQKARGIEATLTPAQKRRVLQPLAYHLMCTEKRNISLTEAVEIIAEPLRRVAGDPMAGAESKFLKEVENISGLLLERELNVYSFSHLVFQEYLAAVNASEMNLESDLIGRVSHSWWHEVLRLYAAQGDASQIVAASLESGRNSVIALSLAIDCLEEALEIAPEWRARTESILEEEIESKNSERFHLAAEAVLARRLRNMVAITDSVFVAPDYLTQAEYQIFMDESIQVSRFHQPDHWRGLRFREGHALKPVLGVRPSDTLAFCEWLSQREGSSHFRPPNQGDQKAVESASKNSSNGQLLGHWVTCETGGSWRFNPDTNDPDLSAGALVRYLLFDRDLEQTRAFSREKFPVSGKDFDYVLSRKSDNAIQLSRDRAGSLNLDETLKMALKCISKTNGRFPSLMRLSAFNLSKDLSKFDQQTLGMFKAFAIENVLNRSGFRYRDTGLEAEKDVLELRTLIRRNTRLMALFTSAYFEYMTPERDFYLLPRRQDNLAMSWLTVYADLAILEGRISGDLPATEGIRIVKETSFMTD